MGGNWNFNITKDVETIDLEKYQKKLIEIRQCFESKVVEMVSDAGTEAKVTWCKSENLPPIDNIFVRFTYKCHRHYDHGSDNHVGKPISVLRKELENSGLNLETFMGPIKLPEWCLYWDPKVVPEEKHNSVVYTRCAPSWDFTKVSVDIQKSLIDEIPKGFSLFLDDGIDGYGEDEECQGYYVAGKGWDWKNPNVEQTMTQCST